MVCVLVFEQVSSTSFDVLTMVFRRSDFAFQHGYEHHTYMVMVHGSCCEFRGLKYSFRYKLPLSIIFSFPICYLW